MIRTARLALALALAAMLILAASAAARTAQDGGDLYPCVSGEPCSDSGDSGGDSWECEPDAETCDDQGQDGGEDDSDAIVEPTLPAQVKRPGKPVKVKRAKVTLAAVCEVEEGCVAATYTLTVRGLRLTATDPELAVGETATLVFKLSRSQLRKLGKRAVKATVTAPGLTAAQIKLRV